MSEMRHTMVCALAPRGMVTIKGAVGSEAFDGAVAEATGVAIPARRRLSVATGRTLAWLAPDELLLLTPTAAAPGLAAAVNAALAGQPALAVEVSDARASFQIAGPGAREVLAKGAPVDLDPAVFLPGEIRRTRLAQVAVAFWMPEPDVFELICFRSVAQYVSDWLTRAASESDVPAHFYPR